MFGAYLPIHDEATLIFPDATTEELSHTSAQPPAAYLFEDLDGDDLLTGEQGRDLLKAGAGADDLHGGPGIDTLFGSQGSDTLRGNAGADVLDGGLGADRLYGGLHADDLDGGLGNDTLTGGAGQDTFYFSSGHDVITDFDFAVDRLLYGDKSISGTNDFRANGTQVGDDVVYALAGDTDNSLTLLDTDLGSVLWLHVSD